ncbi:hypothetical protein [uncultured Bacteroides sp.]|uniref:hypothetical protein n=1 Tax=uncultured Bacteroides sp. TaxID=162156 RepID=UPI0025D5C635|nr:hypothetical protein [uncultured Bacteroides sp.]
MEKVLEHVSDNLSVEIMPDDRFEFLMSTNETAKGFGVSGNTVRRHKMEHADELIEGKHFITSVQKMNAGCKSADYLQNKQILWTKRGIVRLGFFIKSERAKMFRDWAEDLVVNKVDEAYRVQAQVQQLSLFPEPVKRNHNRLTKERLVDILADVARIDDKVLRLSLVDKLTNIKA